MRRKTYDQIEDRIDPPNPYACDEHDYIDGQCLYCGEETEEETDDSEDVQPKA